MIDFDSHIVRVRYRTKSGANAKDMIVRAGTDMAARATARDQVLRMRGVIDVEETEWRGVFAPKCYSHVYHIAFTVMSEREDGSDVTPAQLLVALLQRAGDLALRDEWLEAVDGPHDTAPHEAE
ncbi:MAG TPA: hypothetical protein VF077_03890 [Nitrospiraceae bacterium]